MGTPTPDDEAKRPRIPESFETPEEPDELPLEAFLVAQADTVARYRNMLDRLLSVTEPASADASTLTSQDLGQVALQNGLGTVRPLKVVTALDAAKRYFFMMPVASDYKGGTAVIWDGNRCSMTLYKTLAAVDRLVPDGMKDLYPLKPTPRPVTIGELKGYALYCKLADVKSQSVTPMSDEEKAKRKATRDRNKAKKNGGDAATGD